MTMVLKGLINFAFGLANVGLMIRLLFRLFGANPSAPFVDFLYESTAPLLAPFRGIFTPYVIEPGLVLEFSTIIAIAIYSLVAWLLIEFIDFLEMAATNHKKR
jgi:uncharacterized protein YggT (Ycf19 family)